jgi:HPt (histidine-containing phosphotransfer) domain-containing protein/HAMP domain-containing protein
MKEPVATGRRGGRIVSVGSKLAGATVALMLLVTAGVYVKLSAYQRENLLQAKEMAAAAVSRLFADSCAAPVVFSDEQAIKEALTTLGRNEDVEYGAVFAADRAGHIGQKLGELSRGVPETPHSVIGTTIERLRDRVVISSPVRTPEGDVVAVSTIAFSLARENAAISEVRARTLGVSATVALGLTALLLVVARLAIVGPLSKLVLAAKKLEEGSVIDVDVHSNDEIGQLAAAFRSMSVAIQNREAHIKARNADMRLVLDHVGQGFITVDLDGKMSDERSRIVDEWFGPPGGSNKFWEYLQPIDPSAAQWFRLGWESVREDVMPLDLCLDQLPHSISKGGKSFEMAYRPVMREEVLDKVIVVITDVTSRIERERAEQTQREMVSLFHRILSDRTAFEGFFHEAAILVDAIESSDASDLGLLKRQVHTLKGNCALFGIESVAAFCHGLESRIEESIGLFGGNERRTLRALWTKIAEMRSQFAGGISGKVELDPEEYDAFLEDLKHRVDYNVLVATFSSWKFELASRRLALFAEQIQHLAIRLGKAHIECKISTTKLRLPPSKWGPFWAAFAHAVRNAVDHGVETAEVRLASGKGETASIALAVAQKGPEVVVSIKDDGCGIDWQRIAARAEERGLAHANPRDLEEALFAEGISSTVEATVTSGRGLGLGAVREVVQRMGGRVEVYSQPGSGTTFLFIMPQTMLFEDNPSSYASVARPLGVKALP